MSARLKIFVFCFLISLSGCSPFYTRHYTKGLFYEGMAHKSSAKAFLKKETAPAIDPVADTAPICIRENRSDTKISAKEKTRSMIPSGKNPVPVTQKFITRNQASIPTLKKTNLPLQKKQPGSRHSNDVVSKALLYVLAIVLALGIIALAIYLLPAILIPSAVLSTFMSAVLIAAVIVLLLLAFLIYSLIKLLIDLFKKQKTEPEEDF